MPEVWNAERLSNGTMFLFTVISAETNAFSATLPVKSGYLLRRSTSIEWYVLDILRSEYNGGGALMHCFSESVETARILLNMGLTIAIGGTVTFKNNVRTVEAVKFIPLENMVIETDCPYLSPTPHRGERNSSLNIHYVAEKIAQIKGVSPALVEEITTENAKRFFDID